MIYPFFNAVALDDDGTRWACQREIDCGVFETIGNFPDEGSAQTECDILNEDVQRDNDAAEEMLSAVYGKEGGAQ